MVREISAGGVVIRKLAGAWWMAAVELPSDLARGARRLRRPAGAKPVLTLPKGLIDAGERAAETALREVREETGVIAEIISKLGDSKYVYTRTWGDGEKVFKIVSFYLMRYRSGRINQIAEEMRVEVGRARWVRLDEAAELLAYKGEKQMVRRALQCVESHGEV
jgi:bis(5'-nucleosidyl)-tetraphosphatase